MFEKLLWNRDARKRLDRLARTKPWTRPCPGSAQAAHRLAGMLGPQEALLFYHLARSFYSGQGAIVDAGSFLGKSASLFAAGTAQNPVAPPASRKVHCFDNFRVNESGTVDFIRENYGLDLPIGESTRALFDEQTIPFRTMLEIHAGDFHQVRWTGGPIEILMVDIAKSQSLWAHLVEEMFPSLVPGASVVIQQDYYHTIEPRILVGMEFLSPYFEIPIPRVDWSAVFFCREAIPPEVIARLVSDDFTPEERLSLIDKAIARLAPADRHNALLARSLGIDTNEDLETLLQGVEEIEGVFPAATRAEELWRERLKMNIEMRHGWNLVQAGQWAKALKVADRVLSKSGDESALLMRGCALNGLSRYREAEESLRRFSPAGKEVDQYVPVELARAVMHQERHDEAEQILLESLSHAVPRGYVKLAVTQHITLLRDLLEKRGDEEKAKRAVGIVKSLMPEESEFSVFAEFEPRSATAPRGSN